MNEAGHSPPQRFSDTLANVRVRAGAVHRERDGSRQLVPNIVALKDRAQFTRRRPGRIQNAAITCAQIATMPKNRASEVNVAASSTTAPTMSPNSSRIENES